MRDVFAVGDDGLGSTGIPACREDRRACAASCYVLCGASVRRTGKSRAGGTPALRNGTFAFAECELCVDFAFCEVEGKDAADSEFSRWLGCTSVTPASRRLFSALTAGAAACQYVAEGCSKPQSMEIQRGHHGFQSTCFCAGDVARYVEIIEILPGENFPVAVEKCAAQMRRQRGERLQIILIGGVDGIVMHARGNEIVIGWDRSTPDFPFLRRAAYQSTATSPRRGRCCRDSLRRPCWETCARSGSDCGW